MAVRTKTVAQKYPLLYLYSGIGTIFTFVNYIRIWHNQTQLNYMGGQTIRYYIYVAYITQALYILLNLYMVTSKNINKVKLLLKIVLAVQLALILGSVLFALSYTIIAEVIIALYTFMTLRMLGGTNVILLS